MHPDIERLADILGAPTVEPVPVPWNQSEADIGISFPSDYRELADTYGGLTFNNFFTMRTPSLEPLRPGAPGGFEGWVLRTTRGVGQHLRDAYENGRHSECPYPVFPDPGGLLLWGQNIDTASCFWLTEGDDPDKWRTAVWGRQGGVWQIFEGTTVEFLLAAFDRDPRASWLGISPQDFHDVPGADPEPDPDPWRIVNDWEGWRKFSTPPPGLS